MLNLKKDKRYVLACSFGPDSMALFSMLYNEGYDFVVSHVNYHKRDASNFEEKSLIKYCSDRNILLEVLSAPHASEKVNFQEWARELRYEFFKKCLNKHNCDAVLVAHNEDDLIETYLMQKQRGSCVNFYGIKQETTILNTVVIRPLLHYAKKDLQKYDDDNNVPYSIDSSNLTNDYSRNKIRHTIVEKLSSDERNNIVLEITQLNEALDKFNYKKYISDGDLSVKKLVLDALSAYSFQRIIYQYLTDNGFYVELTKSFIGELYKALSSKKPSFIMSSSGIEFVKEYDSLYARWPRHDLNYSFTLSSPNTLKTDYFEIDFTGDASDRNILPDDYPLIIRNSNTNDEYMIKNHKISLRRVYIDWKMPPSLRDRWPVVINKNNEIIYIPRYRKDFVDNHKSIFKIDVKKLRK